MEETQPGHGAQGFWKVICPAAAAQLAERKCHAGALNIPNTQTTQAQCLMWLRDLLQSFAINKKPLWRIGDLPLNPVADEERGTIRDSRAMWFKNKNKHMGLVREWNWKESENLIKGPQQNTVQPLSYWCLLKSMPQMSKFIKNRKLHIDVVLFLSLMTLFTVSLRCFGIMKCAILMKSLCGKIKRKDLI